MRLTEFVHSPKNTPESNLITALEVIRNRYKDQDQPPRIRTKSLINLVLNTDKTFDYQALVNANEKNSAVKNLIKSLDQDYVELQPFGVEPEEESFDDLPPAEPIEPLQSPLPAENIPADNFNADTMNNPVDVVDDMSKRAARKRGAAIS